MARSYTNPKKVYRNKKSCSKSKSRERELKVFCSDVLDKSKYDCLHKIKSLNKIRSCSNNKLSKSKIKLKFNQIEDNKENINDINIKSEPNSKKKECKLNEKGNINIDYCLLAKNKPSKVVMYKLSSKIDSISKKAIYKIKSKIETKAKLDNFSFNGEIDVFPNY